MSGVSVHLVPISQLRLGYPKDMWQQHLGVIPKHYGRKKNWVGGMMCHSKYLQSGRWGSTSDI